MRKLFIAVLLLMQSGLSGYAQISVGFEPGTGYNYSIYRDSGSLWQIAVPSKGRFTSAHNGNYAMLTDSVNFTGPLTTSLFEISFRNGGCFNMSLSFYHTYYTDSLHSGGQIEVSYDLGSTWTNIVYDTLYQDVYFSNMYAPSDTISGNIPSFTGHCGEWTESAIMVGRHAFCGMSDSVKYRFIFRADSTAAPYEGWMIDDVELQVTTICGVKKNADKQEEPCFAVEQNSEELLRIKAFREGELKVCSLEGKTIYAGDVHSNENIAINTRRWNRGYYYISLANANSACSKLIRVGL